MQVVTQHRLTEECNVSEKETSFIILHHAKCMFLTHFDHLEKKQEIPLVTATWYITIFLFEMYNQLL